MQTYKHVIVVGIDGAGAFLREADTPCFDAIFENGAVTYGALASFPSISAECWGSMLLGVSPRVHGLTNGIVSSRAYPSDSPFPTLFRRIREAMPEAKLGAFCDWAPIFGGIVEKDLGVVTDTANDTVLTPRICAYIEAEKPTFLFVQMDSVDGAGHGNGYGTPAYMRRIHEVDALVGQVYDAVKRAGILDETLFCVIADHGGTCDPVGDGTFRGGHGGWSEGERYVTFAAAGKTAAHGTIGEMQVRDLAAIVLFALGLPVPAPEKEGWTAQIPEGLFDGLTTPDRIDFSDEEGAPPRVSRVRHTSETV